MRSTTINLTAATLRAMLCYIAPEGKPKIAYNDDALAEPLFNKINSAVGTSSGSDKCSVTFNFSVSGEFDKNREERLVYHQFRGIVQEIYSIFNTINNFNQDQHIA